MSKEDLIPITTKERAKELGRKGGLVKSPKKRMAAQLRELKKKGITNSTIRKITDIMEDPTCSALDIKLFLDSIKGREYEKKDKASVDSLISLSNTYNKHGSCLG